MSPNNATRQFLMLPRIIKQLVVLCVDAGLCILTVWLAFYLRLGEFVSLSGLPLWAAMASLLLALPIFVITGLYREIFRYSGMVALLAMTKAIVIYGILYATAFTAFGFTGIPRTLGLIQPILLFLAVGSSRALIRFLLSGQVHFRMQRRELPKALIYGAGSAGRQLADALMNSNEIKAVGFLDDDDRLHGHSLNGLRIYRPQDISGLVSSLSISDVLLAMPSLNRHRRNEILREMQKNKISVRTLPRLTDIAKGKVGVSDLRELDIEDLLGRDPVAPNYILFGKNIADRVVLVTGAGGSIGGELCRQIILLEPVTLLLVDQSEFALYQIHEELSQKLANTPGADTRLMPLLASVRDEKRMKEIIATWQPHTIYHAAAYKHVPVVEHNPVEGIHNNVFGTLVVAKIAAEENVSNFVLISTDKAVRPTNVMGASKRLAEMTVQALAEKYSKTMFSMVRFGNVLGSSGSVIPKFRQQIQDGGPITLTHSEITRYFMTIAEAAQLVIQAGAMAQRGDVFVLDMGEPVRIADLARRMIDLSGLSVRSEENPDGDIEIELIGLRPGEKLYEELLIGNNPKQTLHPRIMEAHEDFLPWSVLAQKLDELLQFMEKNDMNALRTLLEELVSGYQPSSEIVDWIYLEHSDSISTTG